MATKETNVTAQSGEGATGTIEQAASTTPGTDATQADQTPQTEPPVEEGPKKVTVRLHKDRANSEPVFVSVNGERFIIQRGVDVEVPDYVAEVLDHSRRQDLAAADYRDGLVKRYEAKAKQQ